MKMRENDARGRKRRKISKLYIFHEKKHENESCAVFRAESGGPDGKKPVKNHIFTDGSGDISVKICTLFIFKYFFHKNI